MFSKHVLMQSQFVIFEVGQLYVNTRMQIDISKVFIETLELVMYIYFKRRHQIGRVMNICLDNSVD